MNVRSVSRCQPLNNHHQVIQQHKNIYCVRAGPTLSGFKMLQFFSHATPQLADDFNQLPANSVPVISSCSGVNITCGHLLNSAQGMQDMRPANL